MCMCKEIWQDCLNFKHWPIFVYRRKWCITYFYCEIYLELYLRVMAVKKKNPKNNKTQIRHCCMGRLIRTYTVWELIYHILDQQNANRVEQKNNKKNRRRKQVRSSGALFNHSQLELKRPLIFWTRRLQLVFCSRGVFTLVTHTD